jgi:hypothetical protein
MANIVEQLKQECQAAGTNLSAVCKLKKIDRSILERWKLKEPRSLQILNSIRNGIKEIKMQKQGVQEQGE